MDCCFVFNDIKTLLRSKYIIEKQLNIENYFKDLKYIFFSVVEDSPEFRLETIYYFYCTPFTRKTSGIVGQRGQESKGRVILLYYPIENKHETVMA